MSAARSGMFLIKRRDALSNGDVIETGSTGRVVISLSDGSQIIVLPNSRVTLKDFRAAHSMRELLEIAVGTVRVKIRHIGNKPNPYRLNSPAASIAVRGTEFTVDVQSNGETVVAVSEGLVEVSPRTDPADKRLVGPGEFVIIRTDGRIGMAMPGPGSELNGGSRITSNDSDPVQRLATAYQHSADVIAQNSLETTPVLFAAFTDAHLDSLENPAYASEFKQAQGRLLMMPSISRTEQLVIRVFNSSHGPSVIASRFPDKGDPHRFDLSFTPQFTFFTPVRDSRFTLGGSLSAVRTSLHALTLYQPSQDVVATLLKPSWMDGGATTLTAIDGSLVAAYSLGKDGNTSLGLELERLASSGSFLNVKRRLEAHVSEIGFGYSLSRIESETEIARTRVTVGAAHEFNGVNFLSRLSAEE